ncbi:MAG: hypothetical protein Ct9H300mP11_32880 [Chloroflexota bacterium]|nr:MAG: hypothetical protein Ct9H300mP11_32880 [Chloroflexota bacterium]
MASNTKGQSQDSANEDQSKQDTISDHTDDPKEIYLDG